MPPEYRGRVEWIDEDHLHAAGAFAGSHLVDHGHSVRSRAAAEGASPRAMIDNDQAKLLNRLHGRFFHAK
jgi:hypothetical protein